ncbi:MAG: DEAD/DEAH box helicase family protein, partial [Oscillospiraceae bacterium]|nr:DEAD/DEAH box helicase family protein [Oscillospiraceae bacterium]
MENIIIARLAVSAATYAIDKPYDYLVPESVVDKISPGVRVSVPFGRGNRRCEGVVLSVQRSEERAVLKSIEAVLDESPIITKEQIKLALWMHERFFCTVYEAFRAMLPAGLWFKDGRRKVNDKMLLFASLAVSPEEAMDIAATKRMRSPKQADILELLAQIGEASVSELTYFTGAGRQTVTALEKQKIITVEEREVYRRPEYTPYDAQPIVLSEEQLNAYDGLKSLADEDKPNAALLYGVTGSGKTSVYIKLIEYVLKSGKTAMVLVPEIALTPQLMNKFSSYFENDVAVLHSSLGVGERYDEWKRIKAGLVHVVIGTRSAVFAPLENIGVIILDEEQESTYKSESSP